jgi:hypothetical protein
MGDVSAVTQSAQLVHRGVGVLAVYGLRTDPGCGAGRFHGLVTRNRASFGVGFSSRVGKSSK